MCGVQNFQVINFCFGIVECIAEGLGELIVDAGIINIKRYCVLVIVDRQAVLLFSVKTVSFGYSFIVTTGVSTSEWSVGFSYDANSSALERNFHSANAFEVSFAYRINIRKEMKTFSTPLF